ncbi:MAG: class I SAM-dependent methyltransferase, partial [Betaproteobacteria bacterium]|nr:class I SAM-dependent methyltransferase [Betaproteobacteria bacterium]
NLGQLFCGAKLEAGMRVLDFAAGSCWLSRILVQMGCLVSCCDASATALEIGKELFRKYPPVAGSYSPPDFCVFDGETLPFADGAFDRVLVNDAFHHVPNMATVLAEFARVLTPDGIVAMSEPGRYHSRTEESQFEMKTFDVIENDVVLEDLWDMARGLGFADIRISPRCGHQTWAWQTICSAFKVPCRLPFCKVLPMAPRAIQSSFAQASWQPLVHPADAPDQAHSRDDLMRLFTWNVTPTLPRDWPKGILPMPGSITTGMAAKRVAGRVSCQANWYTMLQYRQLPPVLSLLLLVRKDIAQWIDVSTAAGWADAMAWFFVRAVPEYGLDGRLTPAPWMG